MRERHSALSHAHEGFAAPLTWILADVLETQAAACRLYAAMGWQQTARRSGKAFGQAVVERENEIDI